MSFLVVGAVCLAPQPVAAQAPDAATDSVPVVPGPDYAAGGLHRFFWGDHYRDIWTTEVQVPVLDLGRYAGGLDPLSSGGGLQTKSLWLGGADGKTYAFRSLYKTPTELVPEVLRQSFVEDLMQDQMSTHHPYAPLVVAPLLEAVGVLQARPGLYVLPDDPVLGEFREEFAGVLGTLEERPGATTSELASFLGATEIVDGAEIVDRVQADPSRRVDARAFLRARLIDVLVGDWDRHADQWRWADMPGDSSSSWQPIPSDRDQAFVRMDGLVLRAIWPSLPMLADYRAEYDSAERYHFQARFLDRLFLTELERAAWDSTAAALTERLTDPLIDDAAAELPAPVDDASGPYLASTLKRRRDALPEIAGAMYELTARQPYVHASDRSDVVELTGTADALEISIRSSEGMGSQPYFRRTFREEETKDVRILLHGGDDRVEIGGYAKLPIRVNIVGGDGDDTYHFDTLAEGVHLYDQSGANVVTGVEGVEIDARPYPQEPLLSGPEEPPPPRHWGRSASPSFLVGFDPDVGLRVGARYGWVRYAFRRDPYASRMGVSGELSSTLKFGVSGDAEFRAENSPLLGHLEGYVSSLLLPHFYGVGNDTEVSTEAPSEFYDVENTRVVGRASVGADFGGYELSGGLMAGFSNTKDDPGTLFGQLDGVYGAGPFGLVGAVARFDVRTRTRALLDPWSSEPRVQVAVRAQLHPAWIDVESLYGWVDVSGSASVPLGFRRWEVSGRVGGRKIWGDAPWFHLAYVGGSESLRGFPSQRFAGDASVFGGAELRLDLFDYQLLFPSTFGVLGLVDVGRVWVDGASPGGWHSGVGGGVWLALRGTRTVVSLTYAKSTEDYGIYFSMGFPF
jgi:hypothetical protein